MRPGKPIVQLDLEGKVINYFPSTYHAERATDIDREYILKVLKGRKLSTFGFVWKYDNREKSVKSVNGVEAGLPYPTAKI